MPKENKRFINPLLRPTVEAEVKQEAAQVPQPVQPAPPPSPPETNTFTATSAEPTSYRAKEPLPPVPAPEARSSSPRWQPEQASTSTSTDTLRDEEEAPVRFRDDAALIRRGAPSIPPVVEQEEIEDEVFYTSSATMPRYGERQAATPRKGRSIDPPAPLAARASLETQTYPSTSRADVPVTVAIQPEAFSSSSTSTYQSDPLPDLQDEEIVEQEPYVAPVPVRRRRGAQAFEKTHERITLWIDKRLKQAFEELAYEQEVSKTSLLNEAMADLLNKYSSQ